MCLIDEEIAKLRGEVRRLRDIVGEEAAAPPESEEMLDLERDLDACEISAAPAFGRARGSSITENDGDDDGGEDGDDDGDEPGPVAADDEAQPAKKRRYIRKRATMACHPCRG